MIGKPEEIIRWLFNQDRDKVFEVKEHHEKRSLNANAYAWSLISKIADVVRSSKDEVYLTMLKRYGQSEMVSVLSDIDVSGYFKYYEEVGRATLQGKEFTHYRVYKGSSEYDSREMSILIDGIVSEAKELDIETLPPYEVNRLKDMWRQE
jgi:hypothetical protein